MSAPIPQESKGNPVLRLNKDDPSPPKRFRYLWILLIVLVAVVALALCAPRLLTRPATTPTPSSTSKPPVSTNTTSEPSETPPASSQNPTPRTDVADLPDVIGEPCQQARDTLARLGFKHVVLTDEQGRDIASPETYFVTNQRPAAQKGAGLATQISLTCASGGKG